jgi:peptide/nickel transport system substrate-binding protein
VRASIERHLSDDNRTQSRSYVTAIDEMRVVDDRTLVFVLTSPWPGFPYTLATESGMITNPSVVADRGEEFNRDPVGGGVGPYELERYVPGEEIVMRAKDDYWGGPVCIQELRFVAMPDPSVAYDAFRSGEVQVALLRDPRTIADAKSDGISGHSEFTNLGGLLLMNHGIGDAAPPTSDVRVRRAIALAIDPVALDGRVNDGDGLPTSAIMGDDSRYAGSGEGLEHDPEEARQLVNEVQAETGWDGSIRLMCQDSPSAAELCITMAGMLEAAGFSVEDETRPASDFIEQVTVHANFDIVSWGLPLTDSAPWVVLAQFASDSPANRTGYDSPEFDEALGQLKVAATDEDQSDALTQLQDVWNETIPSAAYATAEAFVAVDEAVKGLEFSHYETIVYFDGAYVDG